MDENEKLPIFSFVADDTDKESSKGQKVFKEKSELIFEIATICNMDSLGTQCELLKNKPLTFSDPVYSKRSNNNFVTDSFPMDTDIHFQSEPLDNSFTRSIPHTQIIPPNKEQEINEFSTKQMAEMTDFKDSENGVEVGNSPRTDIISDKTTIIEQEIKEFPPKPMSEVSYIIESDNPCFTHNSQEKCFAPQEDYQQIADQNDCNALDDSKRSSRRSNKRKKDFDGFCPICGVTVRLNDLESHYNQEVERLSKISRCSKKMHLEEVPKNEAFDLVRMNRENRLTARVAMYSARAKNEVKCPVCSLRMSGTAEEINKHVAICIQDEDSDVNVDGDEDDGTESYEEYEIGDETRIRPISLIPGGYRSLHGDSVRQTAEDEDLNVDVDDTIAYGDSQYSEIDVIPNTSSEKDRMDLEQLRRAVAIDSSARPQNLECHKWSKKDTDTVNQELSKNTTDSDPVVSSLKEKIKSLEDQDKSVRCLICLESYTKPVVSTTCWHVHCEECWLMTMGVKKLCPQCNMIVFPSDLRKIYL